MNANSDLKLGTIDNKRFEEDIQKANKITNEKDIVQIINNKIKKMIRKRKNYEV